MSNVERLQEIKALADNNDILAGCMFGESWMINDDFQWLIEQAEKVLELKRELKECYKQNEAFSNEHWRQVHDLNKLHEALEKIASRDSNNKPLYDKYELSWIARQALEELN